MKLYRALLFLYFPWQALSLTPNNLLLMDTLFIEEILAEKIVDENFEKHQSSLPKELLLKVLSDPDGRIHKQFKIPPAFKDRVIFWAQIYTQFTNEQVLIHDRENLSIVYDAIGNSRIPNARSLTRGQRSKKRRTFTRQALGNIKKALYELARTKPQKQNTPKNCVNI